MIAGSIRLIRSNTAPSMSCPSGRRSKGRTTKSGTLRSLCPRYLSIALVSFSSSYVMSKSRTIAAGRALSMMRNRSTMRVRGIDLGRPQWSYDASSTSIKAVGVARRVSLETAVSQAVTLSASRILARLGWSAAAHREKIIVPIIKAIEAAETDLPTADACRNDRNRRFNSIDILCVTPPPPQIFALR